MESQFPGLAALKVSGGINKIANSISRILCRLCDILYEVIETYFKNHFSPSGGAFFPCTGRKDGVHRSRGAIAQKSFDPRHRPPGQVCASLRSHRPGVLREDEKFQLLLIKMPGWVFSAGGTMTELKDNDAQNDGEVMTIKDVAHYLRISEAKVYELARAGAIPALRIGKSWRFQKDLLKQWVRKSAEANITLIDQGD
jgi:excisionase family DNA binding protein